LILKESVLCGQSQREAIQYSQCRMTDVGVWGRNPQPPEARKSGAEPMGVVSRGPCPPWIFQHGTNIVDTGLKVYFSDVFCYFSVFFFVVPHPPWKRLN